jgi:hypothetical protein
MRPRADLRAARPPPWPVGRPEPLARSGEHLRDRGDDYDVYLAIEVEELVANLDNLWWLEHGHKLSGVASADQWINLSETQRATFGLLRNMDRIGDAGRKVDKRLAKTRSATGRHSGSTTAASTAQAFAADASNPLPVASTSEASEVAERMARESQAGLEEITEAKARLDPRLALVRDVVADLVSAASKIEIALETCESIATANEGYFGIGWIRRISWRGRSNASTSE